MKTFNYNGTEVYIVTAHYSTGNVYVGLEALETGEPYADITINLPHYPFKKMEAALSHDDSGLEEFVVTTGLAELSEEFIPSGFTKYRKIIINENILQEITEKN